MEKLARLFFSPNVFSAQLMLRCLTLFDQPEKVLLVHGGRYVRLSKMVYGPLIKNGAKNSPHYLRKKGWPPPVSE